MIRSLFHLLGSLMYRTKMSAWTARVALIVAEPPGTDEGFTSEDIHGYGKVDFSKFSVWEIVCEEVLDTSYPRVYFERARSELRQRGISDEEYDEMRRFAWLTAGWLNFEKMLWDWCQLDEFDIRFAIQWQYSEGWISSTKRDRFLEFADRYSTSMAANAPTRPHPT